MHGYEHYATISVTDLTSIDYDQIGETSQDTLRYNLAGTEFVIKWNTTPTFISNGSVVPTQTLTHEQAVSLMATEDWAEEVPEMTEE